MRCDPMGAMPAGLGDAVLVIGIFDGMHIGHRAIFAQARQQARELGVPLVAVTFEHDPDEIFRADDSTFGKLLSNSEGVGMIVVLG